MIIDKITNIEIYKNIPLHAVEFIKSLTPDIKTGRYELTEDDYANVETYLTKPLSDGKFEAHKNYIDIQILLSGKEKIYYRTPGGLTAAAPYNSEKDIIFYKDDVDSGFVTLDGTNFAVIFPHEAHAPQISTAGSIEVKKVVVKIKNV